MKYSFKKINIEAPFPTTQCGHLCQTQLVYTFKDHLFGRVCAFINDNNWIIHYSLDVLAFDLEHRNILQERLRNHYNNSNIHVITSTTHTHYANSVRDDKYKDYLCNLLFEETICMNYSELTDLSASYQHVHTNAIGKSRISGYETGNEILCLIRFYSNKQNFLNIIYNNCHPTILNAENTDFFSAEYPGYILKRLEDSYPDSNFTFLQGAAGDISSRFVRKGQDYQEMCRLGDNLFAELQNLLKQEDKKVPMILDYKEAPVKYEHVFSPIDLSNIRADLSERELETIRLGQIQRTKLEQRALEHPESLIKEIIISSLDIGCVKMIFFPNEIFSQYIDYIDTNKEMLVSYSNGYGPYVLPLDFNFITYEMFTDTLSKATKERIIETIKTI